MGRLILPRIRRGAPGAGDWAGEVDWVLGYPRAPIALTLDFAYAHRAMSDTKDLGAGGLSAMGRHLIVSPWHERRVGWNGIGGALTAYRTQARLTPPDQRRTPMARNETVGSTAEGATSQELLDAAEKFARENPALLEALRIFGMSTAQYEKAARAMNTARTCTTASTTT